MFEILIVEDNPADVRLVREILGETSHYLTVAEDGEEAMRMLRRNGKHPRARRPDLILLDINLPKLSGHEVLQDIKGDDQLKTIPVVIFSSSTSQTDIDRAFRGHANAYVQKPHDLKGYFDTVRLIESFWLNLSRLPSQ